MTNYDRDFDLPPEGEAYFVIAVTIIMMFICAIASA